MNASFKKGLAIGSTLGADTSDATATVADVLVGETFYGASGTKETGTLPNYVQSTSIMLTVPEMPDITENAEDTTL